jgi:GTP-binding protein Era
VSSDDYQIVFSDTPGILAPHYKLHQSMMEHVDEAFTDADVILYLVEIGEKEADERILKLDMTKDQKLLVIINKIDSADQKKVEEALTFWSDKFPDAEIIPASALHGFNIQRILNIILDKLPVHPPFYPKDELTDKSYRFFVSEIIREKILLLYRKEVPYSVEVVVDQFKEEDKLIRINAYIYVARETQKMIILGKGGKAIKQLGSDARKDIEKFLDKKVFLELTVKVDKDWRDSEQALKRFGY